MVYYAFITWNGSGNQTPTLGLAQALQARGHDILFAGYQSQQGHITAQGFRFALLERSKAALDMPIHGDMLSAMAAGLWATPTHLEDVYDIVVREAPDVLIIDCLLLGAIAAAEYHHLPAIVLVHSAPGLLVPPGGPFEQFVLLKPVNALRSAVALPSVASIWENWSHFPTLCATLPILDPLAASAPPAFTYVGPISEQLPHSGWHSPWPEDDPRPLVLASFSAVRMWDQTSRIQRTLTGLADLPVRLLVTSNSVDTAQLTIPTNAIVVPFIPHEEVFPLTTALVTHGGHGTVTAALAHGIPMVCLPNTTSDQPGLAAQVAALEAGIALDGDTVPAEAIQDAVMQLLKNRAFATSAQRLASIIADTNTPQTAVNWLEDLNVIWKM